MTVAASCSPVHGRNWTGGGGESAMADGTEVICFPSGQAVVVQSEKFTPRRRRRSCFPLIISLSPPCSELPINP